MGAPRGTTTPARIKARERQAQAVALRKAGASYEQIAQQLAFVDRGAAYRSVTAALRALGRDDAGEVLDLELSRLDEMQLAVWPAARRGDIKAIETVLKLQDRRAKYLGLDASDARMAAAAERHADSAQAQAAWLYATMTAILDQLHLSPEQQALAPTIIVGELDRITSDSPQETEPDAEPDPEP